MKKNSSTVTVEVTFAAYDVYQQERGNLFSNSLEVLVIQFLVLIIPHVLAISMRKMMSACRHIYLVLYLNKAYFWSFKFVESSNKVDHVACNIKPTFISRALLHALHQMIYTVRSNIFGEIMKDRMRR